MAGFYAAKREPRYPSADAENLGLTSGFMKRSGVLSRYDVLSAGVRCTSRLFFFL